MNSTVKIKELKKKYGNKTVLNGISLSIQEGETFALLGVNGAGKTTTLECIEGLRKANSGSIEITGKNIAHNESMLRKVLGVQLQSTSLPDSITPTESMKLFCAWHNTPYRIDLLERFGMIEYLKKPYSTLSTGRKRRLHLALALCHNPKILILDEPTAGLDVQGRRLLHNEIRKLKEQGITILLATHDMEEAEELCDRVAFMRNGDIVKIGNPLELTAGASVKSNVVLKAKNDIDKAFLPEGYTQMEDGYIAFSSNNILETLNELTGFMKKSNNELVDLRVERASLEDIFIAIAGGAA